VPGDWKLANVCPIYKGKGGSDSVANSGSESKLDTDVR
jgi:hypothetical protein